MSDTPEDIDAVYAGEYVLGVLTAEERARVETRINSDTAFAELVEFWNDKLSPMAAEVAAIAPPSRLKKRIAQTLFSADDRRAKARMRSSLRFWRLATAAMTALALTSVGALFYLGGQTSENLAPSFVALVAPTTAAPILTAQINDDITVLNIRGAVIDMSSDHAAELWVIPQDSIPRSMGLIAARGDTEIAISAAMRAIINAGVVLAVTLEPLGGSPTGVATGPVVGTGVLIKT